jgi:type IV secretory pathway VirB4 component
MADFPLPIGTYPRRDRRRHRTTYPFYWLSEAQRLRHMLVLGLSGMGKSTALTNFALADIKKSEKE